MRTKFTKNQSNTQASGACRSLRTTPITAQEEAAVLEAMKAIAPDVTYDWYSSRLYNREKGN